MFIRFDKTHECARQTDRQTPHDDIGHACVASRGRNTNNRFLDVLCRLQNET